MARSRGETVQAHVDRLACSAAVITALVVCAPWSPGGPPASDLQTLDNRVVGFTLRYPAAWHVTGAVVATEFARGAACESVEVIDFQPPSGAGGAGFVHHAFVQLCARPVMDGLALAEFMRGTYGASAENRFEQADVAGCRGFRSRDGGDRSVAFLQTGKYRIEMVSAVATDPQHEELRRGELRVIVDSLIVQCGGTATRSRIGGSTDKQGGRMR